MPDDIPTEDWFSAEASTFGDRMAGAREAMGMTRHDLARRLGVKDSTIANWEEDISEPRANKLQLLSGILNVSLTWLLVAEGDGLSGPSEPPEDRNDIEGMLVEMRQIRSEILVFANRLGVLEKRLRHATQEQS